MARDRQKGRPKFRPGQISPRVTALKEARRTEKTGWDNLSDWYKGWAGGGHNFHKQFALPHMKEAMVLKKGMRVIDLGCGAGVLRTVVEKVGGEYVGVDKAPGMIREGKELASKEGSKALFFVSDTALPKGIALPTFATKDKFDCATFLFSIQDIDNHRDAFKNAARLLKSGGRLVIFMLHPAFRIPRMSGWGKDEGRKLTYRRVDRYKSEVTIPLPQKTGGQTQVTSFFYHRPLDSYTGALKDAGFAIEDIKEIYTGSHGVDTEFPHFMLITAKLS
ncbi:MAG: hypothetical protein RLZZ283_233 [Candidatus Parcubacteria bacterium]|jgi:ubiquinone/menaquinone biosynthesis C-methylase UbiE